MTQGTRTGVMLALIVTAAVVVGAQSVASDVQVVRPWWGWVLLGRLHPLVVHFPIGLILAGALFEVVQWFRRRPLPSEVGTFCLGVGLVAGAVAVWLGTLNASHQSITGESAAILDWHRYSGWGLLAVAAAALLAGRVARQRSDARGLGATYAGLMLTSAVLVGVTGHFGGQLVYGSTYVTGVLPWNRAPEPPATAALLPASDATDAVDTPDTAETPAPATDAPPPAAVVHAVADTRVATPAPASPRPERVASSPQVSGPVVEALVRTPPAPADAVASVASGVGDGPGRVDVRVDFAKQIEPMFRATCVECHGPDKVKARLRMDSVADLQKGGKSGPLFVPGDPETSLLMRRVLGLDGEDQMPLDNDPLTAEQLETLRQWIAQGARYDARASTESQP